jgi:prepilin-type processing-associated H-X9-DG protein
MEFRDKFPGTVEELHPKYINDRKVFTCPSNPGRSAYSYVSGLTAGDSPGSVLVFERKENHPRHGRNVLFVDGHVEQMDEGRFQKALQKTMKDAASRGRAVKVVPIPIGESAAPVPEVF